MAYITGTANSVANLLAAIQSACTGNGWTLAGNVLYKGTCFVELAIAAQTIAVHGGSGVDGSNNLTGRSNSNKGYLCASWLNTPVTYPITYMIHVLTAPDEVYVVINFAGTCYEVAAWGQSTMPGLVGNGNWYCGPSNSSTSPYGGVTATQLEYAWSTYGATSLFARGMNQSAAMGVNHGLEATGWSLSTIMSGSISANAVQDAIRALLLQPNQWNSESTLIPIRVYALRPSNFISPVLECAHARLINIKNVSDQQVLTLGTDKWKVYPWFRRGDTLYGGSPPGSVPPGSWYAGHAIRYDGP